MSVPTMMLFSTNPICLHMNAQVDWKISNKGVYKTHLPILLTFLESRPGVTEVRYVEKEPAERHTIISWEQKNCCLLPEDLRNFYQMTDGFLMTWSIKFDGNNMQLGTMVINSISTLCRLGTTSVYSLPNSPTLDDLENDTDDEGKEEDLEKPQFNSKYRIFELDCCNGNGKVCLVYKSVQSGVVSSHAEIWFLDRALYWHFLSDTFTAYYRLMLVHLGLPQWQYALTKYGISPQAKQWFNMYKPVAYSASLVAEDAITFTNKLDPSLVFKNRAKLQNPKKKACAQLPAPQKSQASLVTSKNSSQIGSTTKKMIP
ncbi:tubulin polyglutamylase complex subunit 2 isoform X4 [Chiloscyllium plagiosum]|uniref:tubulin polyglutamylase complex subunit 2 isoform X4 n=1 Tax=Chiloscyllium plagiosum TaxID=36176 RepID=UPI001CB7DC01|nr:tubulin polyglutamylase complex subunit 2 isoform X4 [Chiloscyllium plagiosum]XP_043541534.1 tubulin polyglutamylase complex subunit 2 isoform X4 [Chiloscyllium plagiosum]